MRVFVICLVGLVLSGCSTVAPENNQPPQTQVAETLPREGIEELAIEAVDDYFAVSAVVASDGGNRPERIAEVVTEQWLTEEINGFDALQAMGSRQTGVPVVSKIAVSAVRGIAAVTEVVLHACTTFDDVSVTLAEGENIDAPVGLSLVTIYLVPEDGTLQVDGITPWADTSWCAEG